MKRYLLASTAALALTAAASAADLPSRKAPIVYEAPPMWTGFYLGMNAGYGFGGSNGVQRAAFGSNESANAWNGLGSLFGSNGYETKGLHSLTILPEAGLGGLGLANSGFASLDKHGFIGGGQFGYNYQMGAWVIGFETDLQGSAIRGSGGWHGAGVDPYNLGISYGEYSILPNGTNIANQTHIGFGEINAGIDWFGTVRGRAGYLVTPTLLVYGTGGLTYGGVWAKEHYSSLTSSNLASDIGGYSLGPWSGVNVFNQTLVGAGHTNKTLVGWNIGGGLEWMVSPGWSVKTEALYYDLGSVTLNGAGAASPAINLAGLVSPISPTLGGALTAIPGAGSLTTVSQSRVRFDGIIVRAGVNYHFHWF